MSKLTLKCSDIERITKAPLCSSKRVKTYLLRKWFNYFVVIRKPKSCVWLKTSQDTFLFFLCNLHADWGRFSNNIVLALRPMYFELFILNDGNLQISNSSYLLLTSLVYAACLPLIKANRLYHLSRKRNVVHTPGDIFDNDF